MAKTVNSETSSEKAEKFSCAYEANLSKSETKKNKELILLQVEEARIACDSDILMLKRELAQAQRELSSAESSFNFDLSEVIEAENIVAEKEYALNQAINIKKRLFGA